MRKDQRQRAIDDLVSNALEILDALGVPVDGMTNRRRERVAKAFLAVADVRPGVSWQNAKDTANGRQLQTRQIIAFMNEHLGEAIANSSYDDVRRKDLILPVEALVIVKSAKNPDANTNDGTRGFALHPLAASVIRCFETHAWQASLARFLDGRQTLADQFRRDRNLARVPVDMGGGIRLNFSPGRHNDLQKTIIEQFLAIYGHGAEVLYVGDTADKSLFINRKALERVNFFELSHDKLPDVVAYSAEKNWLYLIEAVTTANPITELRRLNLVALTSACTADVIFVTAFLDRVSFRKFAKDIAWETEVWIAESPEHMIHLNGHKFMGPHQSHR